MESPDLNDIFMRYLGKDCTPEEIDFLLEQLAESDVTPPLQKLLEQQLTDWNQTQPGVAADAALLDKLDAIKKMVDARLATRRSILLSWRSLAVAATIAGMLIAGYLLLRPGQPHAAATFAAQAGERRSLRLPDGSQVILNGDSRLTLADGFSVTNRDVTLSGEAYFDVSQNAVRPFVIHTTSMDIKVLGTAFNVRSYPDEAADETSLIRGKVGITIKGAGGRTADYVLTPMQKLVLSKGAAAKATTALAAPRIDSLRKNSLINNLAETAWTENKLAFDNETLETVALKMAKWYGITVQFETTSFKEIPYTGSFDGETLETVIETIQYSIPMLHYRMENNRKLILY